MFKIYNLAADGGQKMEIDYEFFKFPAGEIHFKLKDHLIILNDLQVTTDLRNSDEILLLVWFADAFRHKKIFLDLLYTPYARQDRRTSHWEPFSFRAFARIINACEFARVTVRDPHSDVTPALLDNVFVQKRLHLIMATPGVVKILKTPGTIIVSPDAGAIKTNNEVAAYYKVPHVSATKVRDIQTGEISHTELHATFGEDPVHFVVLDDICDGGRTFVELAKVLKPFGALMSLYVTVGVFSKGIEVLEEHYDNVFYYHKFEENKNEA